MEATPSESKQYQQIKKTILAIAITILSISAILWISMVLVPSWITFRLAGSTTIAGIAGLLCVFNIGQVKDTNRLIRILSLVAIVGAVLGAFLSIASIWMKFGVEATIIIGRFYSTAVVLALGCTIIGKFLKYTYQNGAIQVFRWLTMGCTAILSIINLISTWTSMRWTDFLVKLTFVAAVLIIFGLIITPLLVYAEKRKGQASQTSTNTDALRAQIEAEVRAKIAAEQNANNNQSGKIEEPNQSS